MSLLLLALGEFTRGNALDPRTALTQYSVNLWTEEHGLPQNTIRAITQTKDGYLWVATDEGLSRFDGYDFVNYSQDNGDLPSNSVTSLAAGLDGSLWIGTVAGLTQWKDRRFHTFRQKDGLPSDSVKYLLVDHTGTLWIVAGENLIRFDGARFTDYMRSLGMPSTPVRAVLEDTNHNLYIDCFNNLMKLQHGMLSSVTRSTVAEGEFPRGFYVDHRGHIWTVTRNALILNKKRGGARSYNPQDGLPVSFTRSALMEDHDGNLWVGTDRGIGRVEGNSFKIAENTRGAVRSIYEDREGDVWVGSSNGLNRFRDDLFTVYGKQEGLPSDEPYTVYQDRNGRIWAGFRNGGLALISGDARHPIEIRDGMPKGGVFSIRETSGGKLLFSGRDGLTQYINGKFTVFLPRWDPRGDTTVFDALEDSSGRLWLGTRGGLEEVEGNNVRLAAPGGALQEEEIIVLAEGGDRSIWAGSFGRGLWHVAGGQRRLYTTADGLGSNQIRALYRDSDGTLWVGTLGGGLSAWRGGRFVSYGVRNGLLSDSVSNITDDGISLWLSTTRGICRVFKKELRELAEHKIQFLHPENYGIADGLRSAQCVSTLGIGGGRHKDGSLWFVTSDGIAVYGLGRPGPAPLPPALHVLEMSVNDRQLDWRSTPQIPPGEARLQIRYTGIHLRAPERITYSYRLEGLDKDWIRADNRRVANYSGLGHGHYRFIVRAALPGGAPTERSYAFDLLPHFYEMLWFRLACVLASIAFIGLLYRLRERHVRGRFAFVLQERARLAREVHDTSTQAFAGISAQLDCVARCMDEGRPARSHLDLARRMARHSMTEARRSLMDLRTSALDNLDLASAIESGIREWTSVSNLEVTYHTDGSKGVVSENIAHHTFRIAQEAVRNVVKHSGASKIEMGLRIDSSELNLTIADDGRGFEQDSAFVTQNGNFGLIGMRERAQQIGGQLMLCSSPQSGTRLTLTVPLP